MRVRGGKTWKLLEPDPSEVEALARRHNLTRPAAMVLANRGIVRPEEVESFLSPSLRNLSDPLLLKDGEKAAERILSACERGERILIYADYDVDGATGGALLYLFLKEVFPDLDVSIHQNDRMLEGYGLKREHLKRAKEKGVSLVVTVDCGISD
ncbi:MAG: single-stranded-DNA-specific exonuclease RecJ, partial [Deltaproteobacteria bacterium]